MSTQQPIVIAQGTMPTFESCPDWGKGGQFILDPATGIRTRVEPEPVSAVGEVADSTALLLTDDSAGAASADAGTTALAIIDNSTAPASPGGKPKKENTRG